MTSILRRMTVNGCLFGHQEDTQLKSTLQHQSPTYIILDIL